MRKFLIAAIAGALAFVGATSNANATTYYFREAANKGYPWQSYSGTCVGGPGSDGTLDPTECTVYTNGALASCFSDVFGNGGIRYTGPSYSGYGASTCPLDLSDADNDIFWAMPLHSTDVTSGTTIYAWLDYSCEYTDNQPLGPYNYLYTYDKYGVVEESDSVEPDCDADTYETAFTATTVQDGYSILWAHYAGGTTYPADIFSYEIAANL